ncbi:MAG: hypothetical protein FD149_403 [Rhodospirillaceae bacterium]|nr:MAG: hypothetical protein FD149_403 [Rhodospirillaceae bacterium]
MVIGGTALPNPGATGRKKGKAITPPSCHFCKTVPVAEGDGRAWETADRAERTPLPGEEEASSVLAFDTYSVGIPPTVYGTSHLVRSVPFASGSSTLSAEGRMKIREAVATLRQNGGRMRVVGYASSNHRDSGIARKAANLYLSMERANAVTRELARAGMETEEVMVSALTTAASLRGLPDLPRADIYLDYDE